MTDSASAIPVLSDSHGFGIEHAILADQRPRLAKLFVWPKGFNWAVATLLEKFFRL